MLKKMKAGISRTEIHSLQLIQEVYPDLQEISSETENQVRLQDQDPEEAMDLLFEVEGREEIRLHQQIYQKDLTPEMMADHLLEEIEGTRSYLAWKNGERDS
jgi:hypothetical protein